MNLIKTIWKQSKWALLAALVVLVVGLALIRGGSRRTDLLLTGVGINVELTQEGSAWLKEDLARVMNAGEGQETEYVETTMTSFSDASAINENYYMLQNILDLCNSDDLDYFILDKTALENLISQNIFLDLDQFFTAEEQAEMEQMLIYAVAVQENEEVDYSARRPVALRLSEIPFFEENCPGEELYFTISSKTTHLSECRTLWDHIMNWKNKAS